jgi:subtilase family serine protease
VITLSVRNIGDKPCPKSVCQIFIRNAHAPRQTIKIIKKIVRGLDTGDEFAFSFTIKLGLGMYEVEAVADRANKIAESDETNNTARLTITGQ